MVTGSKQGEIERFKMGAIFRSKGDVIKVVPTVKILAGTVVAIGDGLIGVATSTIEANQIGWVNAEGEYDVDITAGTAYDIGDLVTVAAKTLAGADTTVTFGPAIDAVAATDTIARLRLNCNHPVASESSSGSSGGSNGGTT